MAMKAEKEKESKPQFSIVKVGRRKPSTAWKGEVKHSFREAGFRFPGFKLPEKTEKRSDMNADW